MKYLIAHKTWTGVYGENGFSPKKISPPECSHNPGDKITSSDGRIYIVHEDFSLRRMR